MSLPCAIECFTEDRLKELGNGEYVYTVDAHPDLTREDGSPSQLGDVLSVQPDGTLQARPEGTSGNYERLVVGDRGLIARPIGPDGPCWIFPLTDTWPNA